MAMTRSRQHYMDSFGTMKKDASTWRVHWLELGEYYEPESFRWLQAQRNRGEKRRQRIINSRPTVALRTMVAGMADGISPKSRAWFRLGPHDPGLDKFGKARDWFDQVEEITRMYLSASNVYGGLHQIYESIGLFGTACAELEPDTEDAIRLYVFPMGQFYLRNSDRLQVDTVYRDFSFTVQQLVQKFGLDQCSKQVRDHYNNGRYDTWIEVVHAIEPNCNYVQGRLGPTGKPWSSVWMEKSPDDNSQGGFLRESGFGRFPVMAPRWKTYGEDVYGRSPAMIALGDVKALQLLERRKAQLVEKIYDPPMMAPVSLRNRKSSTTPGSVIYLDNVGNGQAFRPAIEIPPAAVAVVGEEIKAHADRVDEVFFTDLWLSMIRNEGDPQKTAREIEEIHEEKMLQLGPVFESVDKELLGPLITTTVDLLMQQGKLPPPPPELQGQRYTIDYISIVAQAQKMAGINTKSQLVGFVTSLAEIRPEAVDKLNPDAMVDDFAENLGVKSSLIASDDQVAQLRAQKAQQAQEQQAAAQAMAAAKGAKDLAGANMDGDNALTRVMSGISPIAAGLAGGGQ